MVAAIFALAPLLFLLRSALMPEHTPPRSGSTPLDRSRSTLACPPEQGCTQNRNAEAAQRTLYETRLINMVNARREQAGCPALRLNARLTTSARGHAADMVTRSFASQINPDRDRPDARARKAGYQGRVIEILAAGLPNADEVFAQWTNPRNPASTPVKAKMTDCSLVSAGIAYSPGRVKPTFAEGIWVLDMGDTR